MNWKLFLLSFLFAIISGTIFSFIFKKLNIKAVMHRNKINSILIHVIILIVTLFISTICTNVIKNYGINEFIRTILVGILIGLIVELMKVFLGDKCS